MDIGSLFFALKIICWLVIIGTWIWLLIHLFPVIRTILGAIFFPPKLLSVDPADIPPDGSLSLSVFPCQCHPVLSDSHSADYLTYVLERNWVDEQVPDLSALGDAMIAELCGISHMDSGYPPLYELSCELFFSFACGFHNAAPGSSFDYGFFLGGDSDDCLQILCNCHTTAPRAVPEAVIRLCTSRNIPLYPPVEQI